MRELPVRVRDQASYAGVAQLEEQLICNQQANGSNSFSSFQKEDQVSRADTVNDKRKYVS